MDFIGEALDERFLLELLQTGFNYRCLRSVANAWIIDYGREVLALEIIKGVFSSGSSSPYIAWTAY